MGEVCKQVLNNLEEVVRKQAIKPREGNNEIDVKDLRVIRNKNDDHLLGSPVHVPITELILFNSREPVIHTTLGKVIFCLFIVFIVACIYFISFLSFHFFHFISFKSLLSFHFMSIYF
jgi:hypothetical protein